MRNKNEYQRRAIDSLYSFVKQSYKAVLIFVLSMLPLTAFSEFDEHAFNAAYRKGDLQTIISIIEAMSEEEVNAKVLRDEQTVLHKLVGVSVYSESLPEMKKAIDLLVSKGADLNARDKRDKTPIFYIARRDKERSQILDYLISKGANIDLTDYARNTVLHFYAEKKDEILVKALLKHNPEIDAPNDSQKTPLFVATEKGSKNIVEMLVDAGADINTTMFNGRSLLMQRSLRHGGPLFSYLLDKGANIHLRSDLGRTVLSEIVSEGNWQLAKTILEKCADPHVPTKKGTTVAEEIRNQPESNLALFLTEEHEEKCGLSSELISSIQDTDFKKFKKLLPRKSIDHELLITAVSVDPETKPTILKIINKLVKRGVPVNQLSRTQNKTALIIAAENGFEKTVELLLNLDADPLVGSPELYLERSLKTPEPNFLLVNLFLDADVFFDFSSVANWWISFYEIATVVKRDEEARRAFSRSSIKHPEYKELLVRLFARKPKVDISKAGGRQIQSQVERELSKQDSPLIGIYGQVEFVEGLSETEIRWEERINLKP